jgi:hypothetical protein
MRGALGQQYGMPRFAQDDGKQYGSRRQRQIRGTILLNEMLDLRLSQQAGPQVRQIDASCRLGVFLDFGMNCRQRILQGFFRQVVDATSPPGRPIRSRRPAGACCPGWRSSLPHAPATRNKAWRSPISISSSSRSSAIS